MIVPRSLRAVAVPLIVFLATLLASPPSATAQARAPWPEKAKNLRVLPKDTSREELRAIMEGFSGALGVRCAHCHAEDKADPRRIDFPSDENPNKNVARAMLRMKGDIEHDLSKIRFSESKRVQFGCITCHHGLARPMTLAGTLHATYEGSGLDSTLAQYHALKAQYFGKGAYDFSAQSLSDLGGALLGESKTEDAIVLLQLNVGQNPKDSDAFVALGGAYQKSGNNEQAVRNYQRALELEPRNRDASERLKELTGDSK